MRFCWNWEWPLFLRGVTGPEDQGDLANATYFMVLLAARTSLHTAS
jgi:hypothetical protein